MAWKEKRKGRVPPERYLHKTNAVKTKFHVWNDFITFLEGAIWTILMMEKKALTLLSSFVSTTAIQVGWLPLFLHYFHSFHISCARLCVCVCFIFIFPTFVVFQFTQKKEKFVVVLHSSIHFVRFRTLYVKRITTSLFLCSSVNQKIMY